VDRWWRPSVGLTVSHPHAHRAECATGASEFGKSSRRRPAASY